MSLGIRQSGFDKFASKHKQGVQMPIKVSHVQVVSMIEHLYFVISDKKHKMRQHATGYGSAEGSREVFKNSLCIS